jgi:NADPH2:quinone reductase
MRSVVLESFGPPEVLELRDLARPEIRHGKEVLVRIRAAGINPVDGKIRTGRSAYPVRLPAILGCDGSGVVEEIGTEVSRVRPGDEVYFCQCGIGVRGGTYAEHAVVEEALLARKPRTLDHVTAAAVPLALITAWESLYERARLGAGQQVLIHGGAGGVGHLAVQLAKDAGARVCTTVGSEAKASFVESLGADEPIFYRRENFSLAVLEWTDELGVDIALDTVGGETFELSFGAVR